MCVEGERESLSNRWGGDGLGAVAGVCGLSGERWGLCLCWVVHLWPETASDPPMGGEAGEIGRAHV